MVERRLEEKYGEEHMNPEASEEVINYSWVAEFTVHLADPQSEQKVIIERVKESPTTEEVKDIPHVCGSFEEALNALKEDHEYLLQGGVFTKDTIEAYIVLRMEEVTKLRMTTHPLEFDLYYSL